MALVVGLVAAHSARATTLNARGNEPGWQLEMSETGIIVRTQDGETLSVEPAPAAHATDVRQTYSSVVGGQAFTMIIAEKTCSDTMTGMPYPKTVTLVVGERTLSGWGASW